MAVSSFRALFSIQLKQDLDHFCGGLLIALMARNGFPCLYTAYYVFRVNTRAAEPARKAGEIWITTADGCRSADGFGTGCSKTVSGNF